MHKFVTGVLMALAPGVAAGQGRDTLQHLPDIPVSVTRTPAQLTTLGAAVTVIDSVAAHRDRLTPNLDEALGFVPGLVIENRWNYSLDQRLSIRGFGARANFGWRGVKVLIDGVPQTLPDGQSQLNHLDLSLVNHIEVLRGAASAQYGNAAGGVIAFTTADAPDRTSLSLNAEAGSLGTTKFQMTGGGKLGVTSGTFAVSRFFTGGLREHSAAEQRRLTAGADWALNPDSKLTLRLSLADDPQADNPGALTLAEVNANPDSAAATNLRRDAGKSVTQSQLAIGYRHLDDHWQIEATTWGLTRQLDNPLAAPPPAPAAANEGTWVGVDRHAGGARGSASYRHGIAVTTFGADAQFMSDDRTNQRSLNGEPNGTFLLNQQERVTEFGPFVSSTVTVLPSMHVSGGVRWDDVAFTVVDHLKLLGDGSGSRHMSAASANLGVAWNHHSDLTIWTSIATAFQTPTTTELANQPSGATGLNRDLNPERSTTEELGIRGRRGSATWEVAAWTTSTKSAIIPALDNGGRTYYQNAGQTKTSGVETGFTWNPVQRLQFQGTGTLINATFGSYVSVADNNLNLKGNRLAGLPQTNARLGVVGTLGRGLSLDVDQTFRGSMFADDKNTIPVAGLDAGVSSARLAWHGHLPSGETTLSLALLNTFDRSYIGAVTINGAGGRVFEPAAGRTATVGVAVRW